MADDWKPGDLALCVRNGFRFAGSLGPQVPVGAVRTVHRVDAAYDAARRAKGIMFLGFDGDDRFTYDQRGFRKINPLNEAERAAALRELNTPVREKVQ